MKGKFAMTKTEAMIPAIENDLVHFHVQRMAQRQGEQSVQLKVECSKAKPDTKRIEALKAVM